MRFAVFTLTLAITLLCTAARPEAQGAASQGKPFVIDPPAIAAVERFERTWKSARAASFRVVKRELLRGGKLTNEELAVKHLKPGRTYMRMIAPIEGREIIFDRAKNARKLTVHPGHFPDLTLSLDIEGMLATHDQHHTIASVGFDAAMHVLRSAIERAKKDPHGEHLKYGGEATFAGRLVDRVEMITGSCPDRREVAQKGEKLLAFARRVDMDAYVIYVANPQIRSLTSTLDEGESYVVPAYYAKRSESWFDRETGMPLKQVMWNADGKMYESYEHHELVLDPPLSDADFDPDNPGYDF